MATFLIPNPFLDFWSYRLSPALVTIAAYVGVARLDSSAVG
jgi:hypothetical protein